MILAHTRTNAIGPLVDEWFRREPVFAAAALISALAALPILMAMGVDGRTHLDINIWIKPLKFAASVSLYLGTLAWFAGYLPHGLTQRRWYRWFAGSVVLAATLELAWIFAAAAFGVGSHFNNATPLMAAAYALAGIMVMLLLSSAPVFAWHIRRGAGEISPQFRRSVVLGLALTFALTVIVASYMAQQTSHFIGGNLSDAEGGPLFGWARDGGDLRPAHFFALHAMHFIPGFALLAAVALPTRLRAAALTGFTAVFVAFTVYVFAEALAGRPFLGWLI